MLHQHEEQLEDDREEDYIIGQSDPEFMQRVQDSIKQQRLEIKLSGTDPSFVKRRWKLQLDITGIENTSPNAYETFIAVSLGKAGTRTNIRDCSFTSEYQYTKAYNVAKAAKKVFPAMEGIFAKVEEHSYADLQSNEVRLDLWEVDTSGFNMLLGTAKRTYYEAGCLPVQQSIVVRSQAEKSANSSDVGLVYINFEVTEELIFKLQISNIHYHPRPELLDTKEEKHIQIAMPKAPKGGGTTRNQTQNSGPGTYTWMEGGKFEYFGSRICLYQEAMWMVLFTGHGGSMREQGKAIISLAGIEDLPSVAGCIKNIKASTPGEYVCGDLIASVEVSAHRVGAKDGEKDDENSTIKPPVQPILSTMMSYLKPTEQYMVVELFSADGLAAADPDYGTSNPFVRVKYDGTCCTTEVATANLRPTFNQVFYFPVRIVDTALRTNKSYMEAVLPVEMNSKGCVEFEVWHMDGGLPADFLGGFKFDPYRLKFGTEKMKSIASARKAKKVDSGEEEGEESTEDQMGIDKGLMKKHLVRVYNGIREKLAGMWVQPVATSTVTFDAYFIPDFPTGFDIPAQQAPTEGGAMFDRAKTRWNDAWKPFKSAYRIWYPQAPKDRRFPFDSRQKQGSNELLCNLVGSLQIPPTLATPTKLIHWIRCMPFDIREKQQTSGLMEWWQGPSTLLSTRKGSVQDHAMLLCSALLGMKWDAYVCKGTVGGHIEHAWVMTRESSGNVTFWETSQGLMYHLPFRWFPKSMNEGQRMQMIAQKYNVSKEREKNALANFKGENDEGIRGITDWTEIKGDFNDIKAAMTRLELLDKLQISPDMDLCSPALIAPGLPYTSIEVIFNNKNIWGNNCNHHPACIPYNMDDSRSWVPFLQEQEQARLKGLDTTGLLIGPILDKEGCDEVALSIENEISENIQALRTKKGYESLFEESEVLMDVLKGYLTMLEERCQLDSDHAMTPQQVNLPAVPKAPPQQKGEQAAPAPERTYIPAPRTDTAKSSFAGPNYVKTCQQKWQEWWKKYFDIFDKRALLPVKHNHRFRGMPMHLTSMDVRELRRLVLSTPAIEKYTSYPSDEIIYSVACKVFGLPNRVLSIWVFVACQVPMSADEVKRKAGDTTDDADEDLIKAGMLGADEPADKPPEDKE